MDNFEIYWKELAKNKKLTAKHFIQRAILIALRAKGNAPKEDIVHCLLQKYFSPITNNNKLENGRKPYDVISHELANINFGIIYNKDTILNEPIGNIIDTVEEYEKYKELINSINLDKLGRKYVYYFTVQNGLTPEQQGVQSGHALFVLADKLNKEKIKFDAKSTFFQWIGVSTENDLFKIINKHRKHKYCSFREPDMKNMLTSVAFYPILWNEREEFVEMNYKLLTH